MIRRKGVTLQVVEALAGSGEIVLNDISQQEKDKYWMVSASMVFRK